MTPISILPVVMCLCMTDLSALQAVSEEAQRHFENTCAGVSGLRPLWPQDPLCLHERWDTSFKLDVI